MECISSNPTCLQAALKPIYKTDKVINVRLEQKFALKSSDVEPLSVCNEHATQEKDTGSLYCVI